MIRGLIEKELRQSRMAFLMMLLFLGTGLWAVFRSPLVLRSGGSSFDAMRMLLFVFMPLACLVLAQSVIAGEFRQKAQLFLEGLPLPRWQMIAVKYTLGLGIVWLVTLAMGAGAWWHTQGAELLTHRFVSLIAVKALSWGTFCWSVFFALGFLGRYRTFITLILVIGLLMAEQEGVPVSRFGPFDLMNGRFAFERFVWPEKALWITGAIVVSTTLLGFALGLVRDASVATMLAEKMSTREKVMIGIITLIALMSIGFVEQRKRDAGPVHLPGSVDVVKGAATVSAAAAVETLTPEESAALNTFANATASELDEMAKWLKCESLPPLFLVHRRDFDAKQREDGELDSRQGYMIRLNLTKHKPDDPELQEEMIWMLLRVHHHYRLPSDDRGWVVDGFARWWPRRHEEEKLRSNANLPPAKAEDLRAWLKVREVSGDDAAKNLAAAGLVALAHTAGGQKRQLFVSSILGPPTPHDARASLLEWLHPVSRRFEQTTGMTLEEFASAWAKASSTKEVKP